MAMLTIKNRALLVLLAALGLTACAPPGPGALLGGKRHLDRGEYKQAVADLEVATGVLKTNAHAWNYLGLAYHHSGRFEDAAKAYARALNFDRALSSARYNLGCLYIEANRPDLAKQALTAFTLEMEQDADGFIKLGTASSRTGDLAGAERAFETALRLRPADPEALTGLAVVRQKRGRSADAAEFLSRALRADPHYPPALVNYALVAQHGLKERQLALRLYQQYLALKPLPTNSGPIIVAASELQRELAAPAKVLPPQAPIATTPTPQASPTAPQDQTRTGTVVQQPQPAPRVVENTKPSGVTRQPATVTNIPSTRGTTRVETASAPPKPKPEKRSVISRIFGGKPESTNVPAAVANAPRTPGTYAYSNPAKPAPGKVAEAERLYQQAIAARAGHRVTEAVRLYQQAIQLDPSFFNAQFNLAVALSELGDLTNAADAYEMALAIRPESLEARFNFALLLKQLNHPLDSIREFEKAIAQHPKDARPYIMLGNIYSQQMKQNARAREYYTKALEVDPGNPQGAAIRQWLTDPRN